MDSCPMCGHPSSRRSTRMHARAFPILFLLGLMAAGLYGLSRHRSAEPLAGLFELLALACAVLAPLALFAREECIRCVQCGLERDRP